MIRSPLLVVSLAAVALAGPAWADVVDAGNGVTLECLVSAGAGDQLNLQVADNGYITLDRKSVVSVRLQGAAQNDRLRARWRAEARLAAAAEAAERRRDEAARREEERLAARRAKLGLTLIDGEWLTPAQLEVRTATERATRAAQDAAVARAYAEAQARAAIAADLAYAALNGTTPASPVLFWSPAGPWATLAQARFRPKIVTDYALPPPGYGYSKVGLSMRPTGLGPLGPRVLFDREPGLTRR